MSGQPQARLSLEVCVGGGLRLDNPVIAAAGTFGYGLEYGGILKLSRLGAVVVKGLSLQPCQGHRPRRMVETPAGVLNSIGLQNIGVKEFLSSRLPKLRQLGATVVANCWAEVVEEFGEVVGILGEADGIAAIELNISCPNRRESGAIIATHPAMTRKAVALARQRTSRPLWVKLSPNVADIGEFARIAAGEGADALTVINTILGMAVDVEKRRPSLANTFGGLSGPAIKPIALRMVYEASQAVEVPVIGAGGVMSGRDAVEFFLAGASAVQVGTANLYEPSACERIVGEIESCLGRLGVSKVSELIGKLEC